MPERLREEFHGAGLHCAHRHRNIREPGDEDDRHLAAFRRDKRLKIESIKVRKGDVQHQATGPARRRAGEKRLCGGEAPACHPIAATKPSRDSLMEMSSSTMKTVGFSSRVSPTPCEGDWTAPKRLAT